ncbi:fatty acyl-AMP ligase [Kitasatospora sp. NPDC096147]|uniref:fatty acyl-AMP ligase n=1 Tax=Kitasatospora sp. NPDC096147 TaxID=3364093 RepID=UPI0038136627
MSTIGADLGAGEVRSIPDALRLRSRLQPEQPAYVFLHNGEEPRETLTYRQLDHAARVRAAYLTAAGAAGRNAVLLYPSGLEFVRTLLGCMYAGVAGAPVQVPRRRQGLARLRRVADDAGTVTVLTTTAVKRELEENFADAPELAGLTLVDTESLPSGPAEDWRYVSPPADGTALLQYTSGSTGDPKGVVITHANFAANAAETDELWPCGRDARVISWLPLFHDMGLLFGVVLPLWAGVPSYMMEPEAFIRRPARWLEAVSRFRGTHAAAPSFAYELCVRAAQEDGSGAELDLSSWRVAANGAEPVRWRTVQAFVETFAPAGFAARAMCPGYGLAENTLKVTGSPQDREAGVLWLSARELREGRAEPVGETGADALPLVSSGVTVPGTVVRIVDPATRLARADGEVGEIWVDGPCVGAGYRGRAEESERTFRARIAEEEAGTYLRTGDLGFLREGELYVTGRLKDVIIRQGRNYYPQDIELSAETAVPGLRPNCAAAFAVTDGTDPAAERLVVLVEADGRVLRSPGVRELRKRVRDAVWENQRLEADEVVVLRRGALSRTSSGKVQRRLCRSRYTEGELAQAVVPGQEDQWQAN